MEKICLVKLRKKIINPLLSQGEQGVVSRGISQRVPQQFMASYGQNNDGINNGISDGEGKEWGTPQQFISSFTKNDVISGGVSDNAESEQGGARQFIAPLTDSDMIPHETAKVVSLADNEAAVPGETVSLKLTQEQIKTIRSNSSLMSVFNGELTGGVELKYREDPITIKFEFEPLAPVRLLMSEEVEQMLRISNGYLKTIVRDGKLKSYKIGKGRRYMLEDVLSYLQESLNSYGSPQDTLRAETI
jgi:hypothetical protein